RIHRNGEILYGHLRAERHDQKLYRRRRAVPDGKYLYFCEALDRSKFIWREPPAAATAGGFSCGIHVPPSSWCGPANSRRPDALRNRCRERRTKQAERKHV